MSSANDTQHEGHEPMLHETVLVLLVFTLILQLWKCEDQINIHENEMKWKCHLFPGLNSTSEVEVILCHC